MWCLLCLASQNNKTFLPPLSVIRPLVVIISLSCDEIPLIVALGGGCDKSDLPVIANGRSSPYQPSKFRGSVYRYKCNRGFKRYCWNPVPCISRYFNWSYSDGATAWFTALEETGTLTGYQKNICTRWSNLLFCSGSRFVTWPLVPWKTWPRWSEAAPWPGPRAGSSSTSARPPGRWWWAPPAWSAPRAAGMTPSPSANVSWHTESHVDTLTNL